VKKAFWKIWYSVFVGRFLATDQLFQNYGYAELGEMSKALEILERDEPYRYNVQLYHHLVSSIDLSNKEVLEVGCGRGGGASYVMRYLHPKSLVAVDVAKGAIDFCKKSHHVTGLIFKQADAEDLPFEDESFDIVINVESSHCYGSMDKFVAGVYRVLRHNGYFLFADVRSVADSESLSIQFRDSRFEIIKQEDITANILKTLDLANEQKEQILRQTYPRILHNTIKDISGIKGGLLYESLRSGQAVYMSFVFQKPEM